MTSEAKKLAAAVNEFLTWKKTKNKADDKPAKSGKNAPPAAKKKRAREDVEE